MAKKQKVWLGVFLAMFIVPEVLFSFLISSIASLFGYIFPSLYTFFINPQFFVDHAIYLFGFLFMELLGVLGLLVLNFKFNEGKYRKIITAILGLIFISLSIIFYLGYIIANISFP